LPALRAIFLKYPAFDETFYPVIRIHTPLPQSADSLKN